MTNLVSVMVSVAFAMGAVVAENAAAEVPDSLSAELKVLHKRVGNWQGATTVHKTMWTPEEIRGSNISSCVAILGDRFTLNRTEASNGESDLALVTYDEQRKCYRMWWFGSTGQCIESQGQWDRRTETMTLRSENDRGVTSVVKAWYPDDNTAKWTVVARNRSGDIGFSMEAKEVRVEQLPQRKDAPAGKPLELSAEQEVLERLVGDWKATSTVVYPPPEGGEATVQTSTQSVVRVLGGRFLHATDPSWAPDG